MERIPDILAELSKISIEQIIAEGMVDQFCRRHLIEPDPYLVWLRAITQEECWIVARDGSGKRWTKPTWREAEWHVLEHLMSDMAFLHGEDSTYWPGGIPRPANQGKPEGPKGLMSA